MCYHCTYHLDDIKEYIDLNADIVNVNVIVIQERSFLDMEVLKPIYAATAHIGIHITKPFQAFMLKVAHITVDS